ncbi:MAG: maleylpyruvate isomerase family mycothiol-dependent enzyme [Candidatus Dormibacteraeota bacterium]|uniref:Maleylpyruvate isomerase family mycothiol-dependent enzyme n=2 Tax=Candidatus Aeolococcus gillhamiae TaxID=3127015 RepID=A0A934K3R4_9BACT|nr:maleylpyruvate isomerase family mycothiol-dependent enzyme [Candidatus Dormibacteraeota bacterium]
MTTMTAATPATDVATIPALGHAEAMVVAAAEFDAVLHLLRSLAPDEWGRQTVCELWDVRAMAGHMLGMAEAQASIRQFVHDARSAARRQGGAFVDEMTATQVRERVRLTTNQLIERFAAVAPRAVRARRRVPAPMRSAVRLKQDPPFDTERWSYGFLVDTIFTRDPWIHRADICRATGREMALTPGHDGRIVEGVVAEWALRHGRPFALTLTGPAGGSWCSGVGGEEIELDAVEFCWILAGRAPGTGLVATRVPF